jgi:hypothetical protein
MVVIQYEWGEDGRRRVPVFLLWLSYTVLRGETGRYRVPVFYPGSAT